MVESDITTFFQIQSLRQPKLCIEVFKRLDKVGRLWLKTCKTKGDSGMDRQMFGITNDGKLHPSTKPSSCIFFYDNKELKYRKDCDGIRNMKKNQLVYNFFDNTIFLMGDVTNVMTVSKLEEKKQVKLQKQSSSKITKQRWTLHFERDRILHYDSSTCPLYKPFTIRKKLDNMVRDYCANENGWKDNSKFEKYG